MSEPKYYDEARKKSMMKYQKDKLERVAVWVPKGISAEDLRSGRRI